MFEKLVPDFDYFINEMVNKNNKRPLVQLNLKLQNMQMNRVNKRLSKKKESQN